ncbi:MAG: hypothetical protein KC586_17580, partial [Myxococcales bacterium]|nr:hypothetical protein [Myxococcales bacterium]
ITMGRCTHGLSMLPNVRGSELARKALSTCARHLGACSPAYERGDVVLVSRSGRTVRATLAAAPEYGWALVKLPGIPGPTSVPTRTLARCV